MVLFGYVGHIEASVLNCDTYITTEKFLVVLLIDS